jgi:hypothetical protein
LLRSASPPEALRRSWFVPRHWNEGSGVLGVRLKIAPTRYCAGCGDSMERRRFNGRLEDYGAFSRRRFCSRACMAQGQMKEHSWAMVISTSEWGVRSVEEFTTFELADERLESLAAACGWHPPQGRPGEQAEFGRPVGVERGKILAFVAPLKIQVGRT